MINANNVIKYLKNSICENNSYSYSLPNATTKLTILCIKEKEQEIERLNNIINELEKIFDKEDYQYLQRKLKELKGE